MKYFAFILLFICPFNTVIGSDYDCVTSLKNVLFAHTPENIGNKCYRLEYLYTLRYVSPKSKKQITVNDKCVMIFSKGRLYFKNKDIEYFKDKQSIVCVDHSEHIIFYSSLGKLNSNKMNQFNAFLSDSVFSGSKIVKCESVGETGNIVNLKLQPMVKSMVKGGVTEIGYVYDKANLVLKEYHATYNQQKSSVKSIDYIFTHWYAIDSEKSMINLISMYENRTLSKKYPNYKIILSNGKSKKLKP